MFDMPYQQRTPQTTALAIDVIVLRAALFLGVKWLITKSRTTCPSFFKTQAAAKNVKAVSIYSEISTTHDIGRLKKDRMKTSIVTNTTIKIRARQPIKAKKPIIPSNRVFSLPSNDLSPCCQKISVWNAIVQRASLVWDRSQVTWQ